MAERPTPEEVEAILRDHFAARRSSLGTAALRTVAKGKRLQFWDGADARSNADAATLFDPESCTRSAQRIAALYPDAAVAMGYVLRAGEGPQVYAFAVRGGVVIDGGLRHYGRALGYLGTVVDRADLAVVSQPETLRDGFAALVRRPPPTLQR